MSWLPVHQGASLGRRIRHNSLILLTGTIVGLLGANALVLVPAPGSSDVALVPLGEQRHQEVARPVPEGCEPMSLDERAALVLVVGMPDVTDADDELAGELLELGVGGILITKTNVRTREQIRELIDALRAEAVRPLLVATDEEPGRVSSFGAVIGRSSSARTLARRLDVDDMRRFGARMGRQLAGFGVDLALAPVVDLDGGRAGGVIGDRSFSPFPETTTAHSLAFSRGLAQAGVRATAKHFPGHGRSPVDSHRRLATVDATLEDLAEHDLVPFRRLIQAGIPVVMLGHVAFEALDEDLPASLSPAAYALLRDLGFDGVAMTDSLGMGAVHQRWDFPESAVMAVAAGADAVLATDGRHARRMRDALVDAVQAGDLPEQRLNEAAARMLRLLRVDPLPLVCLDVAAPAGPLVVPPRTVGRLDDG